MVHIICFSIFQPHATSIRRRSVSAQDSLLLLELPLAVIALEPRNSPLVQRIAL